MPSTNSATAQHLETWWREYWQPPAVGDPVAWAEAELEFSARASAYPGPYRADRTPYVRQVLRDFADPSVRQLVLCWSAQSAKTTTLLVSLAYTLANAPGPVLWVMASQQQAQSFAENRLQPLIKDCPALAKHMTGRKHDVKVHEILLDRMTIALQGAQTPQQLASRPIKVLFGDELDKWPVATKNEADALSLALERLKTYRDHKAVLTSTPTREDGPIWQQYLAGTQHRYQVPCPHCGSFFCLEWDQIHYPDSAESDTIRQQTRLICPHCGEAIAERNKAGMLQAGQWQAENPQAEIRSYHLNELYSPWSSWGDLALKYQHSEQQYAAGIPGPAQNFCNSSLALPWKVQGESSATAQQVLALRDDRDKSTLPTAAQVLTCGIDTQKRGFWYAVRAWGANMESWLVEEGFLDTFDAVSQLLATLYERPDGRELGIYCAFMDSGGTGNTQDGSRTAEVYEFARRHPTVYPIKGFTYKMSAPWKTTRLDALPNGKPIQSGLLLYRLQVDHYKDQLSAKLNMEPGAPGCWWLHREITENCDYTRHMQAEERREDGSWHKIGDKRNDLWDCEVYNLAAADVLRLRTLRPEGERQQSPQQRHQVVNRSPQKPTWFGAHQKPSWIKKR